jgi:hypothetical protein
LGKFDLHLKGGRPKSGAELRAVFEKELKVDRAAEIIVEEEKKATPYISGRLKGAWAILKRGWNNTTIVVDVINPTPYANRVNRVGKSAGYADRGAERGRVRAAAEVGANVGNVVKSLWDFSKGKK